MCAYMYIFMDICVYAFSVIFPRQIASYLGIVRAIKSSHAGQVHENKGMLRHMHIQ
jgi:hypothetical protein